MLVILNILNTYYIRRSILCQQITIENNGGDHAWALYWQQPVPPLDSEIYGGSPMLPVKWWCRIYINLSYSRNIHWLSFDVNGSGPWKKNTENPIGAFSSLAPGKPGG